MSDHDKKNKRLGLLLGAVSLTVMLSFMVHFTFHGLPKDGDVHRLQHREGRAGHPLGETLESRTIPPASTTSEPPKESP